MTRDEILCELLTVDAPSPEILLEEDGDLCLDWRILNVSIGPAGGIAWGYYDGERREHGTDKERVKAIIAKITHKDVYSR